MPRYGPLSIAGSSLDRGPNAPPLTKAEKRKGIFLEAPIIPGTENDADSIIDGKPETEGGTQQTGPVIVHHESLLEQLPPAMDLYECFENDAKLIRPRSEDPLAHLETPVFMNHTPNEDRVDDKKPTFKSSRKMLRSWTKDGLKDVYKFVRAIGGRIIKVGEVGAAGRGGPVVSEDTAHSYPYHQARYSAYDTLSTETFPALGHPSLFTTEAPDLFEAPILDQIISDRGTCSNDLLQDVIAAGSF